MKVYYVIRLLKQGLYINTMCPKYLLELETRNRMYCKYIYYLLTYLLIV